MQFNLSEIQPGPHRGQFLADDEDWMSEDQNERCLNSYMSIGKHRFETFEDFKERFRCLVYSDEAGFFGYDHLLEEALGRWSIMASAHQIYFERTPKAGKKDRERAVEVLQRIAAGDVRPEEIPKSVWQPLKEIYLQQKEKFLEGTWDHADRSQQSQD